MTVEVKQGRPLSFAVKIGVAIVVSSVVLGLWLRGLKTDTPRPALGLKSSALEQSPAGLFQIIELPVDKDAEEQHWRHALAKTLDGQLNVLVDGGKVDILTDAYSIEVDFFEQWEEGLKRTISFRGKSDRIAVLALIQRTDGETNWTALEKVTTVERACLEKGVKLVTLTSAKD